VKKNTVQLKELLEGTVASHVSGNLSVDIVGVAYDSRKVKPGFLFVALKGHQLDGRQFIEDAISKGAVAVIGEEFDKETAGEKSKKTHGKGGGGGGGEKPFLILLPAFTIILFREYPL